MIVKMKGVKENVVSKIIKILYLHLKIVFPLQLKNNILFLQNI